eukprot:TRINITY_DN1275_c0_g1_i5.p1 TRINITY_DN1275_c0_g1~~TRINITY_DN1275_c0_g1_i5.p1  ORF type:complete len:141 (+),score=45.08 TRINITY_DN1275_c0_g1_i5:172-594(+)
MVTSASVVLLRSDWAKYAQDAKRRADGTSTAQFTVLSSADGFDDDDDDVAGSAQELGPMRSNNRTTTSTTTTTTSTSTTKGKGRKGVPSMAARSKLQRAQPHVQWSNDGMYTIETVDSDSASSGHSDQSQSQSHSSMAIR